MLEIVTVAEGTCYVCGAEASYGLTRNEKLVTKLCGGCVHEGRDRCARKARERARELYRHADKMDALAELIEDDVPVGEWPGDEEWNRS